jgi:2-alkyl-3-oxoalkanoate reductase
MGPMKILVTGASGFIGGYVVRQLANTSSYSIIATGRSRSLAFGHMKNVTYIQADLSQSWDDLSCDVCIHCAGLAHDNATREQFERHNIQATERLLQALKGCKTFIYISSSSVYDFSDAKVKTESDAKAYSGLSWYGQSKYQAELSVQRANIPSVYILRPRAVYGQGDRVLLPRILKLIKKNRVIAPGSLQVQSSLTHIHNLYEAIEKCMVQSAKGKHTYNITDARVYNLKEVIGEIAYRKFGHKNFLHIPIWILNLLVSAQAVWKWKATITRQSLLYITQHSVLSMEKAKEQLKYAGTHTLFDSLHLLEIDGPVISKQADR